MNPRQQVILNIKTWIPRLFWLHKKKWEDGLFEVIWDDRKSKMVGSIVFKKSKNQWSIKPIMKNSYLIIEGNLVGVIEILQKHIDFDEREHDEIKKIIENKSRELLLVD
jgi:hypothetical protein